ncbi:glycine C-acetyltransferase [Streptomyces sp. MnatMP-M17]|nr:glycine C-acetyltransferase [Streptomyces sp. MnatMP-M17]
MARDHRIGGTPVLPAAAQIDPMLTVCDTTRPDSQWRLDQVAFVAPLDVPASKSGAQAGVEVEFAMDAGKGDECSLSSSRPDGGDGGEQAWSVHSGARATGVALPPPCYIEVSRPRAGCSDAVPLSAVTERRRGSGIEYGPAFRAIRALHRGPARMRYASGMVGWSASSSAGS